MAHRNFAEWSLSIGLLKILKFIMKKNHLGSLIALVLRDSSARIYWCRGYHDQASYPGMRALGKPVPTKISTLV